MNVNALEKLYFLLIFPEFQGRFSRGAIQTSLTRLEKMFGWLVLERSFHVSIVTVPFRVSLDAHLCLLDAELTLLEFFLIPFFGYVHT